MNYARAIRIARAARGFSQSQVAARADLAPSYMSRIERGSRLPRPDKIASIASALGVPQALLDLLAAPPERLRGISEAEASTLGSLLLQLILETQPDG
jgi:transcriptional regulator with XRE-family HTH domain